MKRIFLFAGEQSGDQHGSDLIFAMKKLFPAVYEGCGGPMMRSQGLHPLFHMEDFEIMGFQDTLCSLPKLWGQFRSVRNAIITGNYDAVILVDYPGFNLRMARSLRKQGFDRKVIQYISPSVWAWGKKRIDTMVKNLDLLLTILPFEKDYFRHASLPVTYVGHPSITSIQQHIYQKDWKTICGFAHGDYLAIFPGSRKKELQQGLKKQLMAALSVQKKLPEMHIAISCARENHRAEIQSTIDSLNSNAVIIPGKFRYEMMQDCKAAIAASGTVTLELALHKTPTAVTYEVSGLNRFLIKYFVRPTVQRFCIVNILGKKEIFPEYIEKNYTPEILSETVFELCNHTSLRQRAIEGSSQVIELLGKQNSHQTAARSIMQLMEEI